MVSVRYEKVTKRYDDGTEAVKNLDLEVADGEFLVLLGPSGCGKSTTLRMLAGLEDISEGDIRIDNARINDLPPGARGLGMVFQSYALYPHMNIEENLSFGLKRMKGEEKIGVEEIKSRVDNMAKMLGLSEELTKRPKVLLMDEPLSNLDAELRHQMRGEIRRLHEELGCTTIYVTHDQIEAMTLADRIAILDKGELQQHCPPMEAYRNPANEFVEGFLVKHLNDIKETADSLFKD